ncbi:MAG: hypothetical protein ACR2FX_06585 [Chthoniobacterales bacterium]
MHKVFDLAERDSPGVVDQLVHAVPLEEAVQRVATVDSEPLDGARFRSEEAPPGELYVLAGGQRAPNPAQLLSSGCFKDLIYEAATQFDRIVVDSAPILAVSDTLLMVPYIQTTCMVLRASKTPRNATNRALSLLAAAGNRPAGLILNRLPRRRGAGYYYYYSSPGYGDGASYGDRYQSRPANISGNGASNS